MKELFESSFKEAFLCDTEQNDSVESKSRDGEHGKRGFEVQDICLIYFENRDTIRLEVIRIERSCTVKINNNI
ncbi:hypothetical protein RUM43_014926 [Polyplax serrata]|uniref:Uncharacterized protein n=1 Tax=Polyplax serrata TaxID=468196 RepID=A0AAN8NIM5_POLSC